MSQPVIANPLCDVFYRLCSRGAYTRLEPDDGKPSSPVLRGGSGSDAASLPDSITAQAIRHSLRASSELNDSAFDGT